ncbi:Bulb-type lectin domain - like 1 [Theobroma cacao]|nr:Bulb-type lectin domain - like 1 [Theobroma cacao]
MNDADTKPVMLCSCNDNTFHLYDLPSFTERGRLFSKQEVVVNAESIECYDISCCCILRPRASELFNVHKRRRVAPMDLIRNSCGPLETKTPLQIEPQAEAGPVFCPPFLLYAMMEGRTAFATKERQTLRQAGAEVMVIGNNTGSATAFLIILLVSSSSCLINAQDIAYPSVAYLPNSWINVPVFDFGFWDSAGVTPILISGTFVCGFHCESSDGQCLFAVSIFQIYTLNDLDGTPVWNTNTAGKFVSGLKLSEEGNLVLFDGNNETVWQSFDHPTDTLVPGQALVCGQKLTANVSPSNSSAGLYSLALINDSLIAFLEPDAQRVYFGPLRVKHMIQGNNKVQYVNGSFDRFLLPSTSAAQFIQLESDGHLRAYQLRESKWKPVSDLLINYTGACGFPLLCGEYGVCSAGSCTCPKAEGNESVLYFSQASEERSNLGCHQNIPLSCEPPDLHSHSLLELKDYDYFNFIPHIKNTDRENCKETCLQNCSCKAAIYRQQRNSSNGYCCLLSKIFSFKRDEENINDYNSFSYIKVQHTRSTSAAPGPSTSSAQEKGSRRKAAVLGSTLGVLFTLLLVVGIFFLRGNKIDLKAVKNTLRRN